jgi:asparagine synthase (glutamine-hydrolysing)
MRRLSVIDLEGGHQPIANEDDTIWVVLNGEIYNYRELRRSLRDTRRHQFRSQSDTEVVIHLYEEAGVEMLPQLNGMFALCLVDQRRKRVLLARDRFGEKPLFYSISGGILWFASEIGSLVNAPGIARRVNLPAMQSYLENGLVTGPETAFDGILELRPGCWLQAENGNVETGRWARLKPVRIDPRADEMDIAAQLRETLLTVVRRQLVADVPVGAFLSGGIDSSTVVAAMTRATHSPVKTFTARFEHAPYDESPVAREVARHLGTEHHEIDVPNRGFDRDDLLRVVRHIGQPFSDSSAIPTYFVCREIRRHVKVCLSGDGGDETFAGYPLFNWVLRCDRLAALMPRRVLRGVSSVVRAASATGLGRRFPGLRSVWRATDAAAVPADTRLQRISRLFDDEELQALLRVPHISPVQGNVKLELGGASDSRLRALMSLRTHGSLCNDMLVKVDRMSMAASLEVRAPMLDSEVVNFAAGLPDNLLINKGVGKYILRRAVKDWLPDTVFEHPKAGFSIPLHMYQNEAYHSAANDLLLSNRIPLVRELFETKSLAEFVNRGLSQSHDTAERSVYRSSHQLWALMNLAAWADEFRVSP